MGEGDQIEQVARLIHRLHFTFDQAEWVNQLGWPLGEGQRTVLSADALDRAYATSIEIRAREGNKPPGHRGQRMRAVPGGVERQRDG